MNRFKVFLNTKENIIIKAIKYDIEGGAYNFKTDIKEYIDGSESFTRVASFGVNQVLGVLKEEQRKC